MGKVIGIVALVLLVLFVIGLVSNSNDKKDSGTGATATAAVATAASVGGVGATATAAVATAAAVSRGNAPVVNTGSGTGSTPQVITIIVTATPVQQVIASGNTTGGNTVSNASGGATFKFACTNGAFIVEEPDGNLHMTSEPAQGYDCDFTPTLGGDRYWKGVNAILSSNGTVLEPRNTANNTRITINAGQQYHVQGFQTNGGFALQRNPS